MIEFLPILNRQVPYIISITTIHQGIRLHRSGAPILNFSYIFYLSGQGRLVIHSFCDSLYHCSKGMDYVDKTQIPNFIIIVKKSTIQTT